MSTAHRDERPLRTLGQGRALSSQAASASRVALPEECLDGLKASSTPSQARIPPLSPVLLENSPRHVMIPSLALYEAAHILHARRDQRIDLCSGGI